MIWISIAGWQVKLLPRHVLFGPISEVSAVR